MINNSFQLRYKSLPVAISKSNNCNTEKHNHSEFEILKITSGSSTVTIAGECYLVSAGDLIFINPMQVHSVNRDFERQYSHKCICFDVSLINDKNLAKSLSSETASSINVIDKNSPYNHILSSFFDKVYELTENESAAYQMEIPAYITLIFSTLIKNSLISKCERTVKKEDFVSSVLNYVKAHFAEQITSYDVSRALSFNQSYFCRNFKRNFGMSFSSYLNSYRLSISRKYLEEGVKTVTQIAFDVGFSSATAFSKCFKKQFGVLPSKYKK